ncbi:unnamed protein product [Vitrella brassicaformis CCMP3155]|uniref:Uncharacterized protein n=1 Tax=Vitrella brassicaformis (strain CCMP3155) TaxID=1169540 RepID=A0A0G4FCA0_VITBC|nr:unnamed protein product [Vitrella brassicaformis CCMP3155]|eukprot:CEM10233.1 unnamed protein product [Vitrella brassicaformis CCMP3155]
MPGIIPRPTGVRHNKLRRNCYRYIRNRRANYFTWPPPDSSPLHPIEPWGRQFFVFNAYETIDLEDWEGPRGPYPLLPPKLEADGSMLAIHPVLCVSDFARRPLMYLSREDLDTVVAALPEFKRELQKFRERVESSPHTFSAIWDQQKLLMPKKTYTMQRMKTGEHHSWGIIKGQIRYPKKPG